MRQKVAFVTLLVSLHTSLLWGFGRLAASKVRMVSIHGQTAFMIRRDLSSRMHQMMERPPDPNALLTTAQLEEKAAILVDWWQGKRNVFCITGAGLSTDSGIPDYRGNNGSYHRGHKPMIHQQYMDSEYQRKRYWGRSMVGWKGFDKAKPNVSFLSSSNPSWEHFPNGSDNFSKKGHLALAELERMNYLGVTMKDRPEFYDVEHVNDYYMCSTGKRKLAVVTQNVDCLHERAGSKEVIHLHGKGDILRCMQCGKKLDRNVFHHELGERNQLWLAQAKEGYEETTEMRPDGDAHVNEVDYSQVHVPNCSHCGTGFYKPDVVFFGDTVPKSRVALCQSAVEEADGILVIGSSLAVHSAFRHVRAAVAKGTPVAILNVGDTRAEAEGIGDLLKIEAPASDTLSLCVQKMAEDELVLQRSAAR